MQSRIFGAVVGLMSVGMLAGSLRAEEADPVNPVQVIEGSGSGEEEAPESAISSPPMAMDDPGTPGAQGFEVNLVGTLARAGRSRGTESLLDANLGIGDRIQFKLERPYLTKGEVGGPFQRGLGATEIGLKWRVVDHGGLEIAVYPQYEFNDGFAPMDAEGHFEETTRSIYLPLLLSKSVLHVYTLGINLGYRKTLDHLLDDSIVAFGLGRGLGAQGRILTEVFSERDAHFRNRQTDVRVGVVHALFPGWFEKSRFEFPAFASIGHSVGRTEEGEPSVSFTFGVSVIKKPKG